MPTRPTQCQRCQGRMSEGFIVDQGHGTRSVAGWHPGTPIRSIWVGLKLTRKPLPTTTFRCERCGFLESYAFGD